MGVPALGHLLLTTLPLPNPHHQVNPDAPQKMVRHSVLSLGKRLLTPQPRLKTGFFSWLSKDQVRVLRGAAEDRRSKHEPAPRCRAFPTWHSHPSRIARAQLPETAKGIEDGCTAAGVVKYGIPIAMEEKLKIDLIVVGSTCVTEEGARLGKGEGPEELEWGVLRHIGAVDDSTLVVTSVHDDQARGRHVALPLSRHSFCPSLLSAVAHARRSWTTRRSHPSTWQSTTCLWTSS